MSEKETVYRDLKKKHDKRELKIDAYRHQLKKEIDPATDEWDEIYQKLARLEEEQEQELYLYSMARLEYLHEKGSYQ